MDSAKGGAKPFVMAIINHPKEHRPGRRFEQATFCSQVLSTTDSAAEAQLMYPGKKPFQNIV